MPPTTEHTRLEPAGADGGAGVPPHDFSPNRFAPNRCAVCQRSRHVHVDVNDNEADRPIMPQPAPQPARTRTMSTHRMSIEVNGSVAELAALMTATHLGPPVAATRRSRSRSISILEGSRPLPEGIAATVAAAMASGGEVRTVQTRTRSSTTTTTTVSIRTTARRPPVPPPRVRETVTTRTRSSTMVAQLPPPSMLPPPPAPIPRPGEGAGGLSTPPATGRARSGTIATPSAGAMENFAHEIAALRGGSRPVQPPPPAPSTPTRLGVPTGRHTRSKSVGGTPAPFADGSAIANDLSRVSDRYTCGDVPGMSEKQRNLGGVRWRNAEEISSAPRLIEGTVSPYTMRQMQVGDCPLCTTLMCLANCEMRGGPPLASSMFSAETAKMNGKVEVRFFTNSGRAFVSTTDDRLPTYMLGKKEHKMCAYSLREDEFWISFAEKAFITSFGESTYAMRGLSCFDCLQRLSNWTAETHYFLNEHGGEHKRALKSLAAMGLPEALASNRALVTISTPKYPRIVKEKKTLSTGLVTNHAYAVLDARTVRGTRFFFVRNPHGKTRWNGKYSPERADTWTDELRAALDYCPESVCEAKDDGTFWIDEDSVRKNFDSICVAWDPTKFRHVYERCDFPLREWTVCDTAHIANEPQYKLTVKATRACTVTILLRAHVLDADGRAVDDGDKDTDDMLLPRVYENGGVHVLKQRDPDTCVLAPEYVVKIHRIAVKSGEHTYTVVVHNRKCDEPPPHALQYTLCVDCDAGAESTMAKLPPFARHTWKVRDALWAHERALSWDNDHADVALAPQYALRVGGRDKVRVYMVVAKHGDGDNTTDVFAPWVYARGSRTRVGSTNGALMEGRFRTKINVSHVESFEATPGESYVIVAACLLPRNGPLRYSLYMHSDAKLHVEELPMPTPSAHVRGKWCSTWSGGGGSATNPQYELLVGKRHDGKKDSRRKGGDLSLWAVYPQEQHACIYAQQTRSTTLEKLTDLAESSGPYRPGFGTLSLDEYAHKDTRLVVCVAAFEKGKKSKFDLYVHSSTHKVKLRRVQ